MIEKIKQKGFAYHSSYDGDYLEGEFNGSDVRVYVSTYKNKVDRIMVSFMHFCNETQIINEFNSLLLDFENSEKYVSTALFRNKYIDRNEHISYEMSVNNKEYYAYFNQLQSKEEVEKLKTEIYDNYESVCSYLKSIFKDSEESMKTLSFLDDDSLSKKEKADTIAAIFGDDLTSNSVWFMISEYYGKYYIVLYYDNQKNRPRGEDL